MLKGKQERVVLGPVELDGEDFSGARVGSLTVIESVLRNCSFERAKLDQVCFGGGKRTTIYADCSFDGARIRSTAPGVARFLRCSFRDCRIREFFGVNTEFIDCVFSGTIEKAVFHGSVPEHDRGSLGRAENEFRGNDFRNAKLVDVGFRSGIDLTKQVLPVGPTYLYLPDAEHVLARARRTIIGWTDLELRRVALALLSVHESNLEEGQKQIFINTEAAPRSVREAAAQLYDVLRDAFTP